MYSILRHRVLSLKSRTFDSYDHVILYFEVIKQNDGMLSNNGKTKPKIIIIIQTLFVVIDIFVA